MMIVMVMMMMMMEKNKKMKMGMMVIVLVMVTMMMVTMMMRMRMMAILLMMMRMKKEKIMMMIKIMMMMKLSHQLLLLLLLMKLLMMMRKKPWRDQKSWSPGSRKPKEHSHQGKWKTKKRKTNGERQKAQRKNVKAESGTMEKFSPKRCYYQRHHHPESQPRGCSLSSAFSRGSPALLHSHRLCCSSDIYIFSPDLLLPALVLRPASLLPGKGISHKGPPYAPRTRHTLFP